MIEIDNQLFKLYSSLEKLESLDEHYYKIPTYNKRSVRLSRKCEVIGSNKIDWFDNLSNSFYQFNIRELNTLPLMDYLYKRVGVLDIITCYRYKDSFRKKNIRLRKRISKILEKENLFFLTFTFDDKKFRSNTLPTTNTLRRYVVRWLSSHCCDYVGNIDFGGQNGRVHFHAVVSHNAERVSGGSWRYGALNFEEIKVKNENALSLYVNKLSSHAIKESTKNQYLIYPKKTFS